VAIIPYVVEQKMSEQTKSIIGYLSNSWASYLIICVGLFVAHAKFLIFDKRCRHSCQPEHRRGILRSSDTAYVSINCSICVLVAVVFLSDVSRNSLHDTVGSSAELGRRDAMCWWLSFTALYGHNICNAPDGRHSSCQQLF